MKKVLGILVGLLAVGVLVGAAVAMPPWLHGMGYIGGEAKFGYMHGYGQKFIYGCPMMLGYYGTYFQQFDVEALKEKAEEILEKSNVVNGYIVKDGVVYGFLYENVSLTEVELGEPFVMMWFTDFPLEKDGKAVGFLRISNLELLEDNNINIPETA